MNTTLLKDAYLTELSKSEHLSTTGGHKIPVRIDLVFWVIEFEINI